MKKPEMGTVIPPFTAGGPSTTSLLGSSAPSNRPRFDDRNVNIQNISREQLYGIPTSMMANVHNSASIFAD